MDALRAEGALEVSLIAEREGLVVGHIAFSHARVGEASADWYLLGPMAVLPEFQGRGIGRLLMQAGLASLRERSAQGCVLVGDPAFYGRFGFEHVPGICCAGVPDAYVLALRFAGPMPQGEIAHHPAYSIEPQDQNGTGDFHSPRGTGDC